MLTLQTKPLLPPLQETLTELTKAETVVEAPTVTEDVDVHPLASVAVTV